MSDKVTIAALQQMKRDGKKIAGVVAWDTPMARIADRAGVDLVSVGDSVGVNLWGHDDPLQVTMDEMLIVCKAVRRGTTRALVSCDLPYGPAQESPDAALARRDAPDEGRRRRHDQGRRRRRFSRCGARAGRRRHSGVRAVRADAADRGEVRHSLQRAEFAGRAGHRRSRGRSWSRRRRCWKTPAPALLDFTNSGPVAGAAVVKAVKIPVIGGFGGGPWLDGRVRLAHTAIGYADKWLDSKTDTYVNTAKAALGAFTALIADVRAGKQIKG